MSLSAGWLAQTPIRRTIKVRRTPTWQPWDLNLMEEMGRSLDDFWDSSHDNEQEYGQELKCKDEKNKNKQMLAQWLHKIREGRQGKCRKWRSVIMNRGCFYQTRHNWLSLINICQIWLKKIKESQEGQNVWMNASKPQASKPSNNIWHTVFPPYK